MPYFRLSPRTLFALLLTVCASLGAHAQNPGFETTPVSSNGWTLESSSTSWTVPSGAPLRSGNNTLRVVVTTSSARTARHTSGYAVSIPASGTNYVHTIGYALAGTTGDQARVQAISASGTDVLGTYVNFASTNTWQRFTCSGAATNGASYYPGFQVNGNYSTGGRCLPI
jgi:ABC-type Fe3+-hydroxamate transport system substrate-binding protein